MGNNYPWNVERSHKTPEVPPSILLGLAFVPTGKEMLPQLDFPTGVFLGVDIEAVKCAQMSA